MRRLVVLSAYGASETRHASWFIRSVRALIAAKMRDKDGMEALVRASGVDWTLARPPALTNGTGKRYYRAATGMRPGITGELPRADLAVFMPSVVTGGKYIRSSPVVAI